MNDIFWCKVNDIYKQVLFVETISRPLVKLKDTSTIIG